MPSRFPRVAATLAAGALTLTLSGTAQASHYFLDDVSELFSELMVTEFARFGYVTTEDILRNIDTADERSALADVTGIPLNELVELARMCDFLQIEGVGPKAARLLMATGVFTVADLATRDAASLTAEIEVVNAIDHHTGVDPDAGVVQNWITAAAQVPIAVAY